MVYWIPLLIIALSACGILFLFFRKARALGKSEDGHLVYPEMSPKAKEAEPSEGVPRASFPGMFKIGGGRVFAGFMEKFFRKVRIWLMRVENWLTKMTDKLRARRLKKENDGSQPSDFFEQKEGSSNESKLTALNSRDEKFDEQYWIDILKHEPNSAYPYKKLGEIYTAREDFKEARAVLKYAMKLDPADEEAKAMLDILRGKRTRRKTQSA